MDFNNTGAMRSPFSPRVRQSLTGRRPIGISSAKKNQSKYNQTVEDGGDVIYKTPLITLETYGAPLPVMVTEALTFASGDVSVRMSPCGWCWLVTGRRVVAWPRAAGPDAPSSSGPCAARELTLPQTDLAHKADLVMLFYEDGAQMPSCIGVSPEGIVRYWASVGQEGAYVDVSCELAGQECERIAGASSRAPLVLATTTCTLVLITPTTVDGRATVTCRTLRPPSGWLGGIGRRVSLMFFGSMPAHVDTKLVGVVVLGSGGLEAGSSGCIALVAGGQGVAGPVLQAWRGAELYEHSLRRPLGDAHARPHLGELSSLEIVALDVRASGDAGLLLLLAAVNVAREHDTRYSIAHISLEDLSNPRVTSLLSLRGWGSGVEGDQPPRFLPLPTHVLLYTSKYIALLASSGGGIGDKAEYVDVSAEGDRILGGELCGAALLFSARHGPLRLTPPAPRRQHSPSNRSLCESPMGSPCPSDMYDGNLSLYEIDPHEISAVTTDACGKLKTAFLFHLRRETSSSRDLIQQLFPPPAVAPSSPPSPPSRRGEDPLAEEDVDNVLDRTVLKIATEMLDDMPAGDPRWRGSGGGAGSGAGSGVAARVALGSSAALQVTAQLQDKKRAFTLFLDFLRAAALWQRLGKITYCGVVVRTEAVLSSLAELLVAASALRSLQQGADAHLIDAAIHQVVYGGSAGAGGGGAAEEESEEEDPEVLSALSSGALSASDACFRRVTRVRRVLRALAARHAPASAPPALRAAHAAAALRLLNTVLSEMQKSRLQWGSAVSAPLPPARALLPALLDLHTRAITQCAHDCPDQNLRSQVLEGAATLASIILTDAEPLANNSQTAHIFHKMRREAIQPFIEEGQSERAAVLAEKYKDFELLIEMCIDADDLERLYSYIDKYINEGICELAFSCLSDRGGRHVGTLVRQLGARYARRLRGWLQAGAGAGLRAAQHLHAQHHAHAAHALHHLASEETDSVTRMTTMASLAKLCLLASEESDSLPSPLWRKIESRLALGEQHAALPREIRIHNGLDSEDTRVLQPEELVLMYIESESRSLTEYDYKKALDLTDYIQDMERRDDLRLRVWCACIMRDDWSSCRVEAPHEEMQEKTFFRLLDLVHVMGGDLELLLPPLEDILTAPELAELVSDPRFHFIIKYGYECIDTTRNESMLEG